MRGGRRAGAGRKKNAPNRASAARERAVAASGATPLDTMLKAMRVLSALADECVNDKKQYVHFIRAAAAVAKDCACFVHPRLAVVEQPASHLPVKHIIQVIGGLPVGSTPERPEGTDYDEVPPEETR